MDRGGKGLYLGGLTEFEHYASHYHSIVPSTGRELEEAIARENVDTLASLKLEQENAPKVKPLRVCITNASSTLAYHLAQQVATGMVFGQEESVAIHLYDCNPNQSETLEGLALELTDLASPILHEVRVSTSVREAVDSVSWAFILDYPYEATASATVEKEEGEDKVESSSSGNETAIAQDLSANQEEPVTEDKMSSNDVEKQTPQPSLPVIEEEVTSSEKEEDGVKSEENSVESALPEPKASPELASAARLYHCYGATVDFCSQKDVRVIVCGRYANTGTALMARAVSSIDKSNFIASSCLAEQQARAIIANKLCLNAADIEKVAIWGRTCGDVFADLTQVRVKHYPGAVVGPDPYDLTLTRCVFDTDWLESEFTKLFKSRHTEMEGYRREGGAALVEAVGLVKLARQWSEGSGDKWRCVGVASNDPETEGEGYGVPVGVVFSQPVCLSDGKWRTVPKLAGSQKVKVHTTKRAYFFYWYIIKLIATGILAYIHKVFHFLTSRMQYHPRSFP